MRIVDLIQILAAKKPSKALKDLGPMPKNNPSAYQVYFNDRQAEVKKELGEETKQPEIMKRIGEAWNKLTEDQK